MLQWSWCTPESIELMPVIATQLRQKRKPSFNKEIQWKTQWIDRSEDSSEHMESMGFLSISVTSLDKGMRKYRQQLRQADSVRVHRPLWQEGEVAGHTASQSQEAERAGAQLTFSILFSPRLMPGCCPRSWLFLAVKPFWKHPHRHGQRCASVAILSLTGL